MTQLASLFLRFRVDAYVPDDLEWEVIDNELRNFGIVMIDEEGQLLVSVPVLEGGIRHGARIRRFPLALSSPSVVSVAPARLQKATAASAPR